MTHWRTFPLGTAIELAYGKSLPKGSRVEGGSIPVYGSNGITGWHDTAVVNGPTVIVGRKGSAGAVQFVDGPCFPIDTTYYARPREGFEFDIKFLYYLLRQLDLSRLKTATGVPGLTREDAYRETIFVPPLPEQRRIVDLLSRAEGIVRLRWEAEKKAAELIPALFLDMFGNPATNPKGWPVKLLGELAASEKYAIKAGPFGSALKKEMYVPTGYKIYGQEQVIRDDLSYGDYYIDDSKYRELESCKIQTHDLLISLVGTFGKISVVPEAFQPGIINPRLMKITLDRSQILPRFLKALLTGNTMRARIEDRSHGGTMSIVNVGIMKSLEIFVPPLALQSQFVANADAMLSVQTQQSAATTKAQATFDALLAQAFSA
ncbi:MAG TPA: restriction endonuclease subunit S [Azonexus sp.]|nr:restriction endonuclease subunit S [Azonexus sp.]